MTSEAVTASGLAAAVGKFHAALARHETTLNALNVFPVPDGDTGTNMLRTVEAAVRAADESDGSSTGVLDAIARGSLMGARGNSGVILSQVLRALVGAVRPGPLGGRALAGAFNEASDAAYAAVLRPVEGTVLTVARVAATAAATAGDDVVAVARAARDGAQVALESTPALLAVLGEAGVVDAGGAGLVQLYEAVLAEVAGGEIPPEMVLPSAVRDRLATAVHLGGGREHAPEADVLRYEVMFLLETSDDQIGAFKDRWASLGDSIVVVGGDGIFNCHIHTDDIGGSIDAAVAVGRPLEIRVTDLREQVGELEATDAGELRANGADRADVATDRNPAVTAVVAVSPGRGVSRILRSLGVGQIVAGGQSMNPSTEELLDAIGAAVSREVIVLPNNSNIVPVAHEAAKLAGRAVIVVPTTTVQEGIAALVAYDPGAPAEANAVLMAAAAARVTSGEVTRAARDAATAIGEIAAGSWIGVSRDGVVATGEDCATTAGALVEVLATDEHEILTVIEGSDAPAGAVDAFVTLVAERRPDLAIERHLGGQPVYPILLALE